jgi:hypothetical protein
MKQAAASGFRRNVIGVTASPLPAAEGGSAGKGEAGGGEHGGRIDTQYRKTFDGS